MSGVILRGQIGPKVLTTLRVMESTVEEVAKRLNMRVTQIGPLIYRLKRRGLVQQTNPGSATPKYRMTPVDEIQAVSDRNTPIAKRLQGAIDEIQETEVQLYRMRAENKKLKTIIKNLKALET